MLKYADWGIQSIFLKPLQETQFDLLIIWFHAIIFMESFLHPFYLNPLILYPAELTEISDFPPFKNWQWVHSSKDKTKQQEILKNYALSSD